MAAFTSSDFTATTVSFGRSGYNKDGDEDNAMLVNRGRSGYNGPDDDEPEGDKGRSGYNDSDDE